MANSEISIKQCIDDCFECQRVCLETLQHCLGMGGKHVQPEHISLLQNCALICETTAHFLVSNSDLHPKVCAVCAETCFRCADSCERIAPEDSVMAFCAEICRRCGESCRLMAGGAPISQAA